MCSLLPSHPEHRLFHQIQPKIDPTPSSSLLLAAHATKQTPRPPRSPLIANITFALLRARDRGPIEPLARRTCQVIPGLEHFSPSTSYIRCSLVDMEENHIEATINPFQDQCSVNQFSQEENQDENLNKTPRKKKSRRKRYQPKVIIEDNPKPFNTPKTPAKMSETPIVKRKYVRKAKRDVGNVDKLMTPSSALDEVADLNMDKTTRCCLNFGRKGEEENLGPCANAQDGSLTEIMRRNCFQDDFKRMLSLFEVSRTKLEISEEFAPRNNGENTVNNPDRSLESCQEVIKEKSDCTLVGDSMVKDAKYTFNEFSLDQLFSAIPKWMRRIRRKFCVMRKKRTKVVQKRATNATGWERWKPFSDAKNTSRVVPFVDAHWFNAIEKLQASKCQLTLDQSKGKLNPNPTSLAEHNQTSYNNVGDCHGPQARIDALMTMRSETEKGRKKKRVSFVDTVTSKANQRKNVDSTSKIALSPSSLEESKSRISKKRVNVANMNPIEYVIERLRHLDINDAVDNALVPYAGGGMVVPFVEKVNPNKKQRVKPEVDLDPESSRLWELLVSGRSVEGEINMKWEEERQAFLQRVDSFIDKMRVIGHKNFSRWKGSVLDSVIGVFLTQNVSDYLSSSAFMSLAAKYPAQPKNTNTNVEIASKSIDTDVNIDGIEQVNDEEVAKNNSSSDNLEDTHMGFHEIKIGGGQNSTECVRQVNIEGKLGPSSNPEVGKSQKVSVEPMKSTPKNKNEKIYDWENLRKQACENGTNKERSEDTMDSLDYEALLKASVSEIAKIIAKRGQQNQLAERIKIFLDRLVEDHGSLDLEWLKDIQPDIAKEFLLSVNGLGLKSVECIRLLALHHQAFPVDTNVARICVRLGWVPLQPLPESIQLHLLEMYPLMENIQKYLWPRLCRLEHWKLFLLHYIMITVGKVFCTKTNPNCNACPMKTECKHFASQYASSKLKLPAPEEKDSSSSVNLIGFEGDPNMMPLSQLEGPEVSQVQTGCRNCEPIIEEPLTPEHEPIETMENDIEDTFLDDLDEIPTLNLQEFAQTLQDFMRDYNRGLNFDEVSNALVPLSPESASIPMPKLKNVSRLRTEHLVYELPDSHELLEGVEQREPDDPCPYLLAIWSPGETAHSIEPPKACCNHQDTGKLCDANTCFSCNSIREAQNQMVRGTLLIPCRTANRGRFPLSGTYFQVNEVFADHDSSLNPINVPRDWIWRLRRRTVYFGTSLTSIVKGLPLEKIQECFLQGFFCVRAFNWKSRAPMPLSRRLHYVASNVTSKKKEQQDQHAKNKE